MPKVIFGYIGDEEMGWRKMAQIHYWTPNVNDGHQLFLVQAESIEAFWEWRWADFSLCLKTQQLEDIPQQK